MPDIVFAKSKPHLSIHATKEWPIHGHLSKYFGQHSFPFHPDKNGQLSCPFPNTPFGQLSFPVPFQFQNSEEAFQDLSKLFQNFKISLQVS